MATICAPQFGRNLQENLARARAHQVANVSARVARKLSRFGVTPAPRRHNSAMRDALATAYTSV